MLRESQTKRAKPLKNAPDIKIKEWLLKCFKADWWKDGGGICLCPQISGIKPCWNCIRWDGWINDYRKGKI